MNWGLGLVAAVVYWWIVTEGHWAILAPVEPYGNFYDYLAISLRQGRLDLPASVLGNEAFLVDGKYYGYWAPWPAWWRLPLTLLPDLTWVGHTARLSCWTAAMTTMMAVLGLGRELAIWPGLAPRSRWFVPVVQAGYLFGSVTPFLLSVPFVYHEAILWGTALALVSLWAGVIFLRTQANGALVVATLAAGSAALTRATTGYGAMAGVFLIIGWRIWRERNSRPARWGGWPLAAITVLAGVLFVMPFLYNYARTGCFSRMPYDHYLAATPERIALTDNGRVFRPTNILHGLRAYFDPMHAHWQRERPWFTLINENYHKEGYRLEHAEPFASSGSMMTGLWLLGCGGVVVLWRYRLLWLPAAGAVCGMAAMCSFTAISHRYQHDFLPVVVLLGFLGALGLAARIGVRALIAKWVLTLLIGLSVLQSAALVYRVIPIPFHHTPQQWSAWWRHAVGLPLSPFRVHSWSDLPTPYEGQVFVPESATYSVRFAEGRWQPLAGACPHIQRFCLRITPELENPTGAKGQPLVVNGVPDQGSFVFLHVLEGGRLRVDVDVWGQQGTHGEPFRPAGPSVELIIEIDFLNAFYRVRADGVTVLEVARRPFPLDLVPPSIGENPIGGGVCLERLAGRLEVLAAPPDAIIPTTVTNSISVVK